MDLKGQFLVLFIIDSLADCVLVRAAGEFYFKAGAGAISGGRLPCRGLDRHTAGRPDLGVRLGQASGKWLIGM